MQTELGQSSANWKLMLHTMRTRRSGVTYMCTIWIEKSCIRIYIKMECTWAVVHYNESFRIFITFWLQQYIHERRRKRTVQWSTFSVVVVELTTQIFFNSFVIVLCRCWLIWFFDKIRINFHDNQWRKWSQLWIICLKFE